MALTLKLRSGDLEPLPELTFDAPRIVVGRARGSDLQLPDPSVSLRHASFRERGSEYVLVDEGSENGSYCGELRLARQAPQTVRDGDLVRFGRIWVEVRTGPKARAAEPGAARELARQLVEQALEQDDRPRGVTVTVAGDAAADMSVRLSRQRHGYAIGSDAKAALRFAELPGRSVELRRQGDQVWIRPLSDEAPVRLEGGDPLEVGQRTLWTPGAVLLIGTRRLSFADVTLQVLEQLERSATERLRDGIGIDPPRGAETASEDSDDEADESEEEPASEDSDGEAEPEDAAASPSPPASLAAKPLPRRSRFERWSVWDALVYLLALTVLASSVWAIRWLARFGA